MPDDEILLMDSPFPTTRRITAEAVQYIVSRKWQSIDTAPKDGSAILAFSGGIITTVSWCTDFGYWELCVSGTGHLESDEWTPTHWMPLDWIPAPK